MIREVVRSMRVYQWTKNLVIFAGLVFTLKILDPPFVLAAVAGFFAFSLAVSGAYLLNDVVDVERDRLHPGKKIRPVASGTLSAATATVWSVLLLSLGIAGCFYLGPRFGACAVAYVALTLSYSIFFKHVVLLDVIAIASGFVLRAAAGVELMRDRAHAGPETIELSPWLLVCAFFLALFLAIGKRRHELVALEADASRHRAALGAYNEKLLDQLVAVVTGGTVLAYSVYTIAPETLAKFDGRPIYLTIPFVLYGIFRYLYLMYAQDKGGDPSEHLLRDRATLINVILWATVVIFILTWPRP